jgi:hypothetical protein
LAHALAAALRLDGLVIKQVLNERFKSRHSFPEILPVVDNHLRVGMFLVDTSASSRKALCADFGVVRGEDAPDLATTTCID